MAGCRGRLAGALVTAVALALARARALLPCGGPAARIALPMCATLITSFVVACQASYPLLYRLGFFV